MLCPQTKTFPCIFNPIVTDLLKDTDLNFILGNNSQFLNLLFNGMNSGNCNLEIFYFVITHVLIQ